MISKIDLLTTPVQLHPSGAAILPSLGILVLVTPSDSARQPPLFPPTTEPADAVRALIAEFNPSQVVAMLTHDDGKLPEWLTGFPTEVVPIGTHHLASMQIGELWISPQIQDEALPTIYANADLVAPTFVVYPTSLGLPEFAWPDE